MTHLNPARSPLELSLSFGRPSAISRTEALYRQYRQRVAAWAQRLGGSQVEAEEIVQEVFAVVHSHIERYQGPTALPWLFRITEHTVYNALRRERRRRRLRRDASGGTEELPSLEPSALERLTAQQAEQAVERVLAGLSQRYRTLLVLFEIEGLSGAEIAELTGLKRATVFTRLRRARAHFLKRLRQLEAKKS